MPELPEVETVARLLRPSLVGRRIIGSTVLWARTLGGMSAAHFSRAVDGRVLQGVRRRGKYLRLDLSGSGPSPALIVHLRMSGRMAVVPQDDPVGKHLRVALALDDGTALRFDDVRKFGRVELVADAEARLAALGPEPFDAIWDEAGLYRALRARRRMLKPLLLDQGFMAGLGNIYVDESLFGARIHPRRSSATIRRAGAARLLKEIRRVLERAIADEGSSFDTFYRTPEGQPGRYQAQFQVYGRHGHRCRVCDATIHRMVVGQRGTHVCPRCQRAPSVRG